MKLEQQTTNLELSRKLKELGVKQTSLFYWNRVHPFGENDWEVGLHSPSINSIKSGDAYSSFTASELGELLPEIVKNQNGDELRIFYRKINGVWECSPLSIFEKIEDRSLSNLMAKILIYSIESKLIIL